MTTFALGPIHDETDESLTLVSDDTDYPTNDAAVIFLPSL